MSSEARIYQVSELANEMRSLLEMSYASVWIEGELSTLSTPASGHIYFTIKDDNAQIRCAMFRSQVQRLPFKPSVGEHVKIRGKVSLYTARGDLQCIAQSMEKAGEGELHKAFELLKQKLLQQGLFDQSRKRTLPKFPGNIGVITSESAAALHDILTTLERRCPGVPITVYPSLVQGELASAQLIKAIELANEAQRSDVIILARGGGSLEDLWAFNNEQLAQAIVASKIPIISAVGHEVDFTIADFVADLRAPTPTAAAELVAPDVDGLVQKLAAIQHRMTRQTQRQLENYSQSIDAMQYRLVHPSTRLKEAQIKLEKAAQGLHRSMRQSLVQNQSQIDKLSKRLDPRLLTQAVQQRQHELHRASSTFTQSFNRLIERRHQQLAHVGESLNLVNPLATLKRGYSITRDADQKIVNSADDSNVGQAVTVQLGEGSLECEVTGVAGAEEQ